MQGAKLLNLRQHGFRFGAAGVGAVFVCGEYTGEHERPNQDFAPLPALLFALLPPCRQADNAGDGQGDKEEIVKMVAHEGDDGGAGQRPKE